MTPNSRFQEAIRALIESVGEDPERQGLVKTPERVERAWKFLCGGYQEDPLAILRGALFEEESNEMVIVRSIDFYSLCEHHLLPFFGRCHIAYLPSGSIVGLSKLARVVDVFSRRLQVQERLTSQIAFALEEALNPHGVGIVMEARHLCMMMRGVEKQNSLAVTSCMRGEFKENPKTRHEFIELLGRDIAG